MGLQACRTEQGVALSYPSILINQIHPPDNLIVDIGAFLVAEKQSKDNQQDMLRQYTIFTLSPRL